MINAKKTALPLIALIASTMGLTGCDRTATVTYCDKNPISLYSNACEGCVDIKELYDNVPSKYEEWLKNPIFYVDGRKATSVTTVSCYGGHFHYVCELTW